MEPVVIQRIASNPDLPLPSYATVGSAGMDLPSTLACTLIPGERRLIPTGFAIALPPNYEGQIRPRSGLAFKHGITVLNSPGTVDSDYRGEIKVLLINLGQEEFHIHYGQRIAQLIIAPVSRINWQEDTLLSHATERQAGGFGSTGL